MNAKSKCMLFDFDGTLARTAADMTFALNAMLAARGRGPVDARGAMFRVSGGARALLEFAKLGADGEDTQALRSEFLRLYEETNYRETDLFPEAGAALSDLEKNGWEWGVVTNKPRRYFAPLVARLGWGEKAGMIAGDDCARAKPQPDGLLKAAELCGVPPERCVYVGDDPRDARAAAAAGMPFILAAWGYWTPSQWTGALRVSALASSPLVLRALGAALIAEAESD